MTSKLTVVLPVRNQHAEISGRVDRLLRFLARTPWPTSEVILVDDGSVDDTPRVLERLCATYPRLRAVRHDRPRGLEAAGQTGLERATGDVVLIQESEVEIRLEDLYRLLRICEDESVLAARAESRADRPAEALLRRLRCCGIDADLRLDAAESQQASALQMLRRDQLHRLAPARAESIRLQCRTTRIRSTASVST